MDELIGVTELMQSLELEMAGYVEKMKKDLATLRTGRANPQLIENIRVEYYGTMMPLNQVAAISQQDGRTLVVAPWDAGALEAVEKGILQSDLGVTPQNDGKIIRLALPSMTEDRRRELAKTIKGISEDFKVKIRNGRRDGNEKIKKAQKAKEITEDDAKRFESDIQKMTDRFIAEIDKVIAVKEKEIMTV
ncbi:MAG: ribosome recycling factor [Elusimicrobiaceae bacterium]|nr:ribosome recycling factor [Elusimicrobiaceae bacterium]